MEKTDYNTKVTNIENKAPTLPYLCKMQGDRFAISEIFTPSYDLIMTTNFKYFYKHITRLLIMNILFHLYKLPLQGK